jgi:hypothetical protein
MDKEFKKWYKVNEMRFHHGQFDDMQIAYSAWLEGRRIEKELQKQTIKAK